MRKLRGFTMIELLIVMAIMGILAAVALPTYRKYVQKSNRTDAKISLTRLASLEERFYFRENNYTANFADIVTATTTTTTSTHDTVNSDGGYYSIVVSFPGGLQTGWSMTATAQGNQALDTDCATFTLTSLGAKTAKNSGGTSNTQCW